MWTFNTAKEESPDNDKQYDDDMDVKYNGNIINYTKLQGAADLEVWHRRLAHTNEKYILNMCDRNVVKGITLTKRKGTSCDIYHLAKQKQKSLLRNIERVLEEPNDIIYADILHPGFGLRSSQKYVLIIIDGYSLYVTIYIMNKKSEANDYKRQYITFAERQANKNVKQVITDSGGEFVNHEIEEWYAQKGIIQKRLASHAGSHAAQLNLSERVNQSITDMTKAMLLYSGLPNSFWVEAMETACYIKNRIQGKGSQNRTPYELFYGHVPDIHHIRIFGSLVYAEVPPSARRKMEPNCEIGYHIGYNEDVIGCKVYFPATRAKKFVSDYRVDETIVYGDRYEDENDEVIFTRDQNVYNNDIDSEVEDIIEGSDMDGNNEYIFQEHNDEYNVDEVSQRALFTSTKQTNMDRRYDEQEIYEQEVHDEQGHDKQNDGDNNVSHNAGDNVDNSGTIETFVRDGEGNSSDHDGDSKVTSDMNESEGIVDISANIEDINAIKDENIYNNDMNNMDNNKMDIEEYIDGDSYHEGTNIRIKLRRVADEQKQDYKGPMTRARAKVSSSEWQTIPKDQLIGRKRRPDDTSTNESVTTLAIVPRESDQHIDVDLPVQKKPRHEYKISSIISDDISMGDIDIIEVPGSYREAMKSTHWRNGRKLWIAKRKH